MKSFFRKSITEILAFTSVEKRRTVLRRIPFEAWDQEFGWLDRSGLALPLYARLQTDELLNCLTPRVLNALAKRYRDNQLRMRQMLGEFQRIVSAFHAAQITYCCVKGFGLFPDYLPDMALRHQTDFDFLVDGSDMDRAQDVLIELGYVLTVKDPSGERRFATPNASPKTRSYYLYQPIDSGSVELHSHFWEKEEGGIAFPGLQVDWRRSLELCEVEGVTFFRLEPAVRLAYQLLHFFRHLSGTWARLLWLYEIARYLSGQNADSPLWSDLEKIWADDVKLRQASRLVLHLAAQIFHVQLPASLAQSDTDWQECRLWIANFSYRCLLEDIPGNKTAVLFLAPFFESAESFRRYRLQRLFPVKKLHSLDERPAAEEKRLLWDYRWKSLKFQLSRVKYHGMAWFEFALRQVQWNYLILKKRGL